MSGGFQRLLDVSPLSQFAPRRLVPWTYSAFPVKTQAPGGETFGGRTDEETKRP